MSDAHHKRMMLAFSLVDPGLYAKRLAERGLIPTEAAERVSWRDRIAALVRKDEIEKAGVTVGEIAESVRYFTATEPRIETDPAGSVLVIADGYRAGPAGDH